MPTLPRPEFPGVDLLRGLLVRRISDVFNDRARGEKPVTPQIDALLPPDHVVRRVHGDVIAMTIGGTAALLMQMLHPRVLAGVWDHSRYADDIDGRLRRTARFIAVTTYTHRDEALVAISRVRAIHARITGTLPDGTPYAANDPDLLAWVHLTETISFLDAWRRFSEPAMTQGDRDDYVEGMARIGALLGADPVPTTEAQARRQLQRARPHLLRDSRVDTVRAALFVRRSSIPGGQVTYRLVQQAAIDLLPFWARRLHGLPSSGPATPVLNTAIFGMAGTVRWAFMR